MTRKFFLGLIAGIVAITAATVVTVSSVNARTTESDLLIKNLEALTRDEDGDGSENSGTKQLLMSTGDPCKSVVAVGAGYLHIEGTWHVCRDDPNGTTDCNNGTACVSNQ